MPPFLHWPSRSHRNIDYNCHELTLVGRDEQLSALNAFLTSREMFSWWWLRASGGMGKSKLAYEWLYPLGSWHKGLWRKGFWRGDTQLLQDWLPIYNTVIVLDDAVERPGESFKVIEQLCRKAHLFQRKVRVLLVDRLEGEELKKLKGTQFAEHLHSPEPLLLERFSQTQSNRLAKQLGIKATTELDQLTDQIPLYYVIAAGETKHSLSREDMLFREAERLHTKATAAGLEEECIQVLALATLTRGLPWDSINDSCHKHKNQFASLLGKNCDQRLGPVRPDIVGAAFILHIYDNLTDDDVLKQLKSAWKINPQGTARSLFLLANDFSHHRIYSLLDRSPNTLDLASEDIPKALKWWSAVRVNLIDSLPAEQLNQICEYWRQLKTSCADFTDDRKIQLGLANGAVNAICRFGEHQKWPEMNSAWQVLGAVAKLLPDDREIQLRLAMSAVNAINSFGEHEKWPEMNSAWQVLGAIAKRFPDDREIQLVLATGAVNAINSFGKYKKGPEMNSAWQELAAVAKRFPDDRKIQWALVKGAVNVINSFGEHKKGPEMNSARQELGAVAKRFSDDREIQSVVAEGAFNAISRFGEHEKWPEMDSAWQELAAVAKLFPDDREIQLRLAKGAVNAIVYFGKHKKWPEMDSAWQELTAIAKRFTDDREIQLILAKGAVNAIARFGEHEKWLDMDSARKELSAVAKRFTDNREIQLEVAMGAVNAIIHFGEHKKWLEMDSAKKELAAVAKRFQDDREIQSVVANYL